MLVLVLLSSCGTYRLATYEPDPVYRPQPAPAPVYTPRPAPQPEPVYQPQAAPQYAEARYAPLPPADPYDTHYDEGRIQVAFLLDASGSMDGLIEQAKAQFWQMIDDIAYSYGDHYMPLIEVALVQYGHGAIGGRARYMEVVVPFTTDLDWVADALYHLYPSGGREYAGEALQMAHRELSWSPYPEDLKLVYIAGNESFDQGQANYAWVLEQMYRDGIVTNTIFAGDYYQGIQLRWEDAASIGRGTYAAIDIQRPVSFYSTPYDAMLCDLNAAYNATFIPYGTQGMMYYERVIIHDRYALGYGQACQATRVVSKARPYYRNPRWDLIDAMDRGLVSLEGMNLQDLPPVMRDMSAEQRRKYIRDQRYQRTQLRARIQELARDRQQAVARRPVSQEEPANLRQAVRRSAVEEAQDPRRPQPRPSSLRPVVERETGGTLQPQPGTRRPQVESDRREAERQRQIQAQREAEQKRQQAEQQRR
ncbi:MAG: VWA domain-containing protein, partial [Bacteroidetes bacterium]